MERYKLVAEVRKWGLGKGKNKCGRKEKMPAGQLRKGEMDAKERYFKLVTSRTEVLAIRIPEARCFLFWRFS